MQAATLTFVVVASQIGTGSGQVSRTTGAALLHGQPLLSAALFPALAVKLLPAESAPRSRRISGRVSRPPRQANQGVSLAAAQPVLGGAEMVALVEQAGPDDAQRGDGL